MAKTQMPEEACREDQYHNQENRCCDLCPAGQYVHRDCDGTRKTECMKCPHDSHTATPNYLKECIACRSCNGHVKEQQCTATEDTQCICMADFYCEDRECRNCQPSKRCPEGEGVKGPVTEKPKYKNTVCVPCVNQTFSNVTDSTSSCQRHTRCEDLGRVEETPGTSTADAVCGSFKSGLSLYPSECSWILPATLWSGLALTSFFILLAVIFWKKRCKSRRADFSKALFSPVEPVPEAYSTMLPLPSTEVNGHFMETCGDRACETSLMDSVDDKDVCTLDSVKTGLPFNDQPSATVQVWSYTRYFNGESGSNPPSFTRNHSEPQENEWCGA